ncbi:ABC transporter ATP-binding protein [Pseudonocardia sp. DSM 110487]|uniref:ABC transporter ATP-binding protein n=1 Tax=Pseudonocardia sp. DSM 110487 TaxID=2865833 RepID=UPI001C69F308|nr:ABC transporter ATP-binding protein [Pseudonocardia sp. DSM 110487]QYN36209.1 ABC transporter ATP-binding protein [Pseudonocardia sp. DSM 110487]
MTLLAVQNLTVDYGSVRALDGADLVVEAGETVGIVGESGSGKSTLGSAIGRLLPRTAHVDGEVRVAGEHVLALAPPGMRRLRRERLGFVFQDPIAALDPTMRIGAQLRLVLGRRADPLPHLERVRLADPARVARLFPHQLSGGMAQRVALAIAMAGRPRLLVADEPTSALDAQVREDVLGMLFDLAAENGTTILWLSHDLTAVARRCSRIAVMYGGRVVEDGPVAEVLDRPAHPYTAALARSAPAMAALGERLAPVPGRPPVLDGPAAGCAFAPRCAHAEDRCATQRPGPSTVRDRQVLCHLASDLVNA